MKALQKFTMIKSGVLAALAMFVVLGAGCMGLETPAARSAESKDAVLGMRIALPANSGNLQKSSAISLTKLVVVLTSNSKDTIRDTITSATIPALNASVLANQTVGKFYALKPLRTWKLVAKTLDSKDSLIHFDSTQTVTPIGTGDTLVISLSMNARFVMYQANFSLPDSIGSSDTNIRAKQKIYFDRLVLQIDGVNVADSTRVNFAPAPGTNTLTYDYVRTGDRVVRMLAYGNFGNGPSQLLYKDSTNINPASDTVANRNMVYVGPSGNTARGNAQVTIRKVYTVTLNGTPESNPFP
jgi:hypothetical protein